MADDFEMSNVPHSRSNHREKVFVRVFGCKNRYGFKTKIAPLIGAVF